MMNRVLFAKSKRKKMGKFGFSMFFILFFEESLMNVIEIFNLLKKKKSKLKWLLVLVFGLF